MSTKCAAEASLPNLGGQYRITCNDSARSLRHLQLHDQATVGRNVIAGNRMHNANAWSNASATVTLTQGVYRHTSPNNGHVPKMAFQSHVPTQRTVLA